MERSQEAREQIGDGGDEMCGGIGSQFCMGVGPGGHADYPAATGSMTLLEVGGCVANFGDTPASRQRR